MNNTDRFPSLLPWPQQDADSSSLTVRQSGHALDLRYCPMFGNDLHDYECKSTTTRLFMVSLAIIIALTILIHHIFLTRKQSKLIDEQKLPHPADPVEPPIAPLRSLFFNHILVFLRFGPSILLRKIRSAESSARAKFYTIIVGFTVSNGQRIYSFNHPEDLKIIFRNDRLFTWKSFVVQYTKAFEGLRSGSPDDKIVMSGVKDKSSWYYKFVSLYHKMAVGGQGGYMDEANIRASSYLAEELSKMATDVSGTKRDIPLKLELGYWMHQIFLRATAGMYFGRRGFYEEALSTDPARAQRLLDNYILWEKSVTKLTTPGFEIFNRLFYGKIVAAREEIMDAHRDYLDDPERLAQGMSFIRERRKQCIGAGFSLDGNTRSDMTLMFGSITNVRSAAYWCVYHAYNNERIRNDIALELFRTGAVRIEADGIAKIHMPTVTGGSCLHLRALFDEVLRCYQDTLNIRFVKDDVPALRFSDGNEYMLRQNSVVLVSGANLFSDPATWGEDADVFNPYRFINAAPNRLREIGFKPFGGGQTLCAGRKIAWSECSAIVASLVPFFNIKVPDVAPRPKDRDGMGVLCSFDECFVEIEPVEGKTVKEIVFEWD